MSVTNNGWPNFDKAVILTENFAINRFTKRVLLDPVPQSSRFDKNRRKNSSFNPIPPEFET
jgi:hypothetical protein